MQLLTKLVSTQAPRAVAFVRLAAHLGYLREEFDRKRRWLDDVAYGEFVALR